MDRQKLLSWCEETLRVSTYKDYAPNGLQVEGTSQINKIVTAVTASQAAIDYAIQEGADMLLVHHGLFWKSEPVPIIGWKKQRIAALLVHDINMVGFHLPLDAHETLGNNAQLARVCGWEVEAQVGDQNLLMLGNTKEACSLAVFLNQLETSLGRRPLGLGRSDKVINKLAWCTGGAQGYFQTAIDLGVDAFITGEVSEAQYHLAQECDVAFVSAGHHATERFGVQALGEAINRTFDIPCQFFDEQNPV
ncbi:MAG: Nif3-like dinuclear metal center hexameric protein [Neisseriaceae bacterium]|nr:Nif3-like dinuclear metal center hexameric protein [Neisseriaceae bacterium]